MLNYLFNSLVAESTRFGRVLAAYVMPHAMMLPHPAHLEFLRMMPTRCFSHAEWPLLLPSNWRSWRPRCCCAAPCCRLCMPAVWAASTTMRAQVHMVSKRQEHPQKHRASKPVEAGRYL